MATKKELETENGVSDFNASSIPLTQSGKIGQSGIRSIKSMYSSGVSLKRLEEAVADCSFTPSGQKAWKTFLEVAAFESSLKDPSVFTSLYCESVSGGTFQMGALPSDGEAWYNEKPRHKVKISSAMLVMKYPVTQVFYEGVMWCNPSRFQGVDRPVECVSWYDAVAFANALSERFGLNPAYEINGEDVVYDWKSNGWRLPTEAEWEYLARGGEEHLYSGSDDIDSVAWYIVNSGFGTHPVGQKQANGFGLYDMSGNVWEWCWDWYGDYSSGSVTDPRGPSSGSRWVNRGGSWFNDARYARASRRDYGFPSFRNLNLGFRLLRKKI